MMSSENPFVDPARPYGHMSVPRTVTTITSPRKTDGAVNKTLNLSDENPFYAVYGGYRYPAQVDPSKRITTQNTARSTESKSLHMSEENPFNTTHDRYQPSTLSSAPKRYVEPPKPAPSPPSSSLLTGSSLMSNGLSLFSSGLSPSSSFSSYRPSLIRQYSAGDIGSELSTVSNSIADWTRNNPAPLSYRPIHVQRPPLEHYSPSEPLYIPPSSPPRSQPPPPPLPPMSPRPAPATSLPAQPRKANPSAPMDKTSLNMSPDNPFAATHGRYHYPSPEEVRAHKRETERTVRFADEVVVNESRPPPPPPPASQSAQPAEAERKETNSSKANNKFTRFDITF